MSTERTPDVRKIAERVFRLEAEAILGLIPKLDEHFERAVELLRGCSGRVIVTGMGKSGLIGRKIAATLASTGTPAYFLHPAEGVHGDLGMVARGDVVLALSNSGETDEVLAILPPHSRPGMHSPWRCSSCAGSARRTTRRCTRAARSAGARCSAWRT